MLKKTIASLAVAGILAGGTAAAVGAGAAYAGTPVPAATSQTQGHPLSTWLRAHRKAIRREAIVISAKTIGITPKALVSELRSGKSVATVAGEHNVSAQTVVNALVAAADARINQAVAAHKLTTAQAQAIENALPGRVTKAVNHIF